MRALRLGRLTFDWRQAQLMGVINLTPDSFSDGAQIGSVEEALQRAEQLAKDGVVILDVGGESTRPGAMPITPEVEQDRILPVVAALAQRYVVSVDTYHARTAEAAVRAGAALVNDISGGLLDSAMLPTVARLSVPIVLGHLRGKPETMQSTIAFNDVVAEVVKELDERRTAAERAGIDPACILLDPGLGFGKRPEHSWALLAALPRLAALGCPLVIGASRKTFLGLATGRDSMERDAATAAVTAFVAAAVPALIRVHNPASQQDALAVGNALRQARQVAA